ncbi:MAG TPA: hypothetical protein VNX29_01980 [Kaistia sp.]|nr:hypothetical protein [Kaistia sp.]
METAEGRRLRIKAATRDLVAACGGVERAADIVDMSKSEVSRWQSASSMSSIIPVDAILALEAECSLAPVTAAMAAINGRALAEGAEPGLPVRATLIARQAASMAAEAKVAQVFAEIHEDGVTTPAELERLQRALGDKQITDHEYQNTIASARAESLRVVGGTGR